MKFKIWDKPMHSQYTVLRLRTLLKIHIVHNKKSVLPLAEMHAIKHLVKVVNSDQKEINLGQSHQICYIVPLNPPHRQQ